MPSPGPPEKHAQRIDDDLPAIVGRQARRVLDPINAEPAARIRGRPLKRRRVVRTTTYGRTVGSDRPDVDVDAALSELRGHLSVVRELVDVLVSQGVRSRSVAWALAELDQLHASV